MKIKRLLVALCATALFASPLVAQDQPKAPAAAGAPAAADKAKDAAPATPAKRTPEDVQGDLRKAGMELREVMGSPEALTDLAKRKEVAPKAIPVMKRMNAALAEMGQLLQGEAKLNDEQKKQAAEQVANARLEFLTIMSAFGDAESTGAIESLAKAAGPGAVDAQAARQLAAFWTNPKDEAAQNKALDEMQKIAKANPKEDSVAQTLSKMAEMGPASKAISDRAENIITTDLTGEMATQMATQIKGTRKMKDAVGKPVELTGTTVDGSKFTTKDWKGKVVLVDFWATWCGPCIRELPRVKKIYLDQHAKGLEILGVSCDSDAAELKGFLDKNKDMPWPQLFDKDQNPKLEWSPLAKEWGINAIPTMFLIDRKGILRSTDAREDFETAIPKLLEEKAE
jgi:thiol-disulfide isomerase/thioredoxin